MTGRDSPCAAPVPVRLSCSFTASPETVMTWGPVARRLITDGFEVVAVELRGHGDSSRGRDGYGPRRLAADLAQVLSALDLRDVILVGHSMGGMASMTLMLEHPELGGRAGPQAGHGGQHRHLAATANPARAPLPVARTA